MTMKEFSTCDLSDEHPGVQAIELQFRSYGRLRSFGGAIVTLKCYEDNSLLRDMVAEPGQGRVIVVDGGGSLRRSLLGDMLADKAAASGWAGLLINGAVRDVAELADISLGVQALGNCPLKTDKRGAGERGLPLRFGGVDVLPGHYLYADPNGVIISEQKLV